jgi:dTDP-4-amino-4,6-dideoxygalactose transaminase
MEPYVSHDPHAGLMLPHTNALLDRVLTLPSGSAVDADAIDLICNVLHQALTRSAEVRRTLEAGPPVPTYFWRRT